MTSEDFVKKIIKEGGVVLSVDSHNSETVVVYKPAGEHFRRSKIFKGRDCSHDYLTEQEELCRGLF